MQFTTPTQAPNYLRVYSFTAATTLSRKPFGHACRLLAISSIAFLFIAGSSAMAQSTSPWVKVGDATFGDLQDPTPGAAYMTAYVRAVAFYQNSNWWTSFVEKNRQAVITVNLDGTIAGTHVSQTKTGMPVDLRKNKSTVDLGYAGIVVDHLPTTFNGMTMAVQVNKTAQDGLAALISQVAQLSATTPPTLSISQQAMGITSLSKSVADFLFHANLLVKGLTTQNALPAGGLLPPGIYASLAGDSQEDYQQYLAPGTPGLHWSGSQLTYNNAPVEKISYFIIEVAYQKQFFAKPTDALSFGGVKSWAALYQLAEREIPTINTAADATKTANDVQSHLSDARTLLDADADYIQDEKNAIALAVYDDINTAYHDRLTALGITPQQVASTDTPATPAHGNPLVPGQPPVVRPNLLPPTDSLIDSHASLLNQIMRENHPMTPAGGPH